MSLREQLEGIQVKHGELTPRLVLDTARDPKHPLHSRFEWDDEVAGERYRLAQARDLIREVKISYVDAGGQRKEVRRYHAMRAADETQFTYDDIEDILRDPVRRKILLRDMEREWRQMLVRFENLQEFWALVRASLRRKKAS